MALRSMVSSQEQRLKPPLEGAKRRSSTGVDDFRDHVGGRPARSALTGAISIAIYYYIGKKKNARPMIT